MLACWNEQSKERPTFKELRAKFDAMLLAEKKDMYIALFIGENKSNCQSLPPVTAKNDDENRLTRKLASSKVSTTSLDETRSAGRGKKSNCTRRRPDRLSLEVFTHGQQRQLEDRYVSSPAMSPILQKSEMERCIKENMPIIEISVSQNHL